MKQHIKLSKTQVNKGVLDFSHLLDAACGQTWIFADKR